MIAYFINLFYLSNILMAAFNHSDILMIDINLLHLPNITVINLLHTVILLSLMTAITFLCKVVIMAINSQYLTIQ